MEAIDLLNTLDNEIEPTKTVLQKEEQSDPGFHWPNPEMPSSLLFAARCTHVDNSGQIYLQLETNKSTMKSVHDELMRTHRGMRSGGGRLQEGRECIARWSDNRWYRACVLSYGPFVGYSPDCDMVYVLFVDFGNATIVKTKHIRSNLTSKDIPIQAIRVVLGNVKPRYGDKWSEECLDHIHRVPHADKIEDYNPVRVTLVRDSQRLSLNVNIQIHSNNGIWIELSELRVQMGGAIFVDSLVETSELAKRWKTESHGVGFSPAKTFSSNDAGLQLHQPIALSLPIGHCKTFPPLFV